MAALGMAVPLFAVVAWLLIGGVISVLAPGLLLLLTIGLYAEHPCKGFSLLGRSDAVAQSGNACDGSAKCMTVPSDGAGADKPPTKLHAAMTGDDEPERDCSNESDAVEGPGDGAQQDGRSPAFQCGENDGDADGALQRGGGVHEAEVMHGRALARAELERGALGSGCGNARLKSKPAPGIWEPLDLFADEKPNLTVVLDLDETLVRSCEEVDVPVHLQYAALTGMLLKVEVECSGTSGPTGRVFSFLRPDLFEFLERLSNLADVYIFTAGEPDYARPLVQHLDREGTFFLGSYYREATVATNVHDHVKDLTRLGMDLRRTVLVDNNPYSFLLQPDNGILCEPFYGEADDSHLLGEVLPLLQLLARVPDVRPILRRRFNLASWCRTLGRFYN